MSIKSEATEQERPSPLEQFAGTIALMGQNRTLLAGINKNDPNWTTLLEDLAMLCDEGVTFGLRTFWARRVAAPVYLAFKEIAKEGGNPQAALDVLKQCADTRVQTICSQWIRERFHA